MVAGQVQATIVGAVTPASLQKVRNRRPGRINIVKEDTLEPKIIELVRYLIYVRMLVETSSQHLVNGCIC